MSSDRNGTFERRDALIPFGGALAAAAVDDPAIFSAVHLPDEQAYGIYVRRCTCRTLAGHNLRGGLPRGASHAAFIDGVVAEGKTEVYDAGRPMRVYHDV